MAEADDTERLDPPDVSDHQRTTQPTTATGRPSQAAEVRPGSRFGRYVLLEPIGAGGMGRVYAAHDAELGRRVAIKVLAAAAGHRPDFQARLIREAQALAQLSHRNVVRVYDTSAQGNRVFVVMEYVEGTTVTRWLHNPREPSAIIDVFLAAGEGLAAAHEAGLVHRDFKPDNVIVGNDGRVRVLDFGLAISADEPSTDEQVPPHERKPISEGDDHEDLQRLTQPGRAMGTPAYMAPEQHFGERAGPAADQFSFCVALFEALYRIRPFSGMDARALAHAKTDGEIERIPRRRWVSARIHRAILRGLSPTPRARWRGLERLLHELRPRAVPWRGPAIVGAAAVAVGATMTATRTAPADCEHAATVQRIWNQTRRAAARTAMIGALGDRGELRYAAARAPIDAWVAAWRDTSAQACEAAARGERSPRRLAAAQHCLDAALMHLDALVETGTHGGADAADRMPRAAHALPPIAACTDPRSLASDVYQPDAPGAPAVEVRRQLAQSWAHAALSEPQAASTAAAAGLSLARSAGERAVLAEALAAVGRTSRAAADRDAAERSLIEAAWLATATGHDHLAPVVFTEVADVIVDDPERAPEARWWLDHARAAADRVRPSAAPSLLQRLAVAARVDLASGNLGRAMERTDRMVAVAGQELPDDDPRIADAWIARATVLAHAGDPERSRRALETAAEVLRRGVGPGDPVLDTVERALAKPN